MSAPVVRLEDLQAALDRRCAEHVGRMATFEEREQLDKLYRDAEADVRKREALS